MHRRKSSKEDDDNIVVLAKGEQSKANSSLNGISDIDFPSTSGASVMSIPPSRSRVSSTPSQPPSSPPYYTVPPPSAGPFRTSFSVHRTNGLGPSHHHPSTPFRQSFSVPSHLHGPSHTRTRSTSGIPGPFSPSLPSPLSTSFPSQPLLSPSHSISSFPSTSTTSDSLSTSANTHTTNGSGSPSPTHTTAHPRRHTRLHSRNLSIFFPRPGSLPHTSIAEDGAQELDFGGEEEVPVSIIPNASPTLLRHKKLGEGFIFGARPPPDALASSPLFPNEPSSAGGSGSVRRGHHHKHSLSHNFFSFLEPGAELHAQPAPVPVSPWNPISPFPQSADPKTTSFSIHRPSTSPGLLSSKNVHESHSRSPISPRSEPSQDSVISDKVVMAAVGQFALGAWLWVAGQQVGSLSCTGLGYWIVFDSFGVAVGRILPSYLRKSSMQAPLRRAYGNGRLEAVALFAQAVYLMFSAVYVFKETVEHLLLSAGESHHHHHPGDDSVDSLGSQHRTLDLLLATAEAVAMFSLAYPSCVTLGAVLLQIAPQRGTAGGRMEAFLRAMREIERHPLVLHLPPPHIWQLTPTEHDPVKGAELALVVTLELRVSEDLRDEDVLKLTRWAWGKCMHALGISGNGAGGGVTNSKTHQDIVSYIEALNNSVVGVKLSDECSESSGITPIIRILDRVEEIAEQTPPVNNSASRFGNPAFKVFFDKIQEAAPSLHETLPNFPKEAIPEVSVYFEEAWGNRTRIDYGSGMELNFLCWLICLERLGVVQESDHVALVIKVFWRYIQVMRTLQSTYWLEPAGSHGVWGLDDYHFLPFLFGSAQLRGHKYLRPKSIHDVEIVEEFSKDYMYLACIQFINSVKTASLRWHSPMLDDISVVKTWEKVNSGLMKMYLAEVLGKLPVVQHFLFGSILPYEGPIMVTLSTDEDDAHGGHAHAHPDLGGAGQSEVGWGNCCGIPVPSAFAAAQAEKEKHAGERLVGPGIRPVPFD
ncbi:hypothetical protein EW146_g1802 [Bondarzewia mesenterica]|uniref:peptidylprolyl isomerase n=1 Tax=Bondarzewia mesenterica TaxID=1095465 RepID=A0A4S4M4W6_9AGAM|nr:hypothetical protein EW146_g1802 [Bondarzewia mesenterica]